MPRRLSDIVVDEESTQTQEQPSQVQENKPTGNKTVRRLSDIPVESTGQKILNKVSDTLTTALGEGMATGEFDKMSPLGKTLDIISRPSAAVKSLIKETRLQEPQRTFEGKIIAPAEKDFSLGNRLDAVVKGLTGQERVSANELWSKQGIGGIPGLGFATEIALDPLTYGSGAIAKALKAGTTKTISAGSKIPAVANVGGKIAEVSEPAVKAFKKAFINTTGIPQLDDLVNKYTLKREYLKGASFKYGLKVRNVLENIAKKTGKSVDDLSTEVVNLIELPEQAVASLPETRALANSLKNHFSDAITAEMKAGVPITTLAENNRGIQYFPRITTDEAKQYLKNAARQGGFGSKAWNPKIANAIQRKTGDFTLGEFNTFVKENGLESLGGRSVEQFFMKNPAYATAIRGTRSAKAITSAEFIQDAGKIFGKTLQEMPYGQELPESIIKIYPALKGKVFDPEVLGEIGRTYETVFNPKATMWVLKHFDTVVNYWKKWTLMPFAKYHLRNVVGNIWNNYLAGVDNSVVYAKAAALQRYGKIGKESILKYVGMSKTEADDIILNAKKFGVVSGTQFHGDIPNVIEDTIKGSQGLRKFYPTRIGGAVGSTLENNARLAHFVDKLEKGLSPADAAMSVKKFLFDYGDLTTFEKQVMKRLFPFYTWTRKNIPLQLEQIIENPQKFVPLMKMLTSRDENDLLRLKYANPTLYDRLPVELKRNNDIVNYVPLEGLIPAADLGKLPEPQTLLFDLLNPYIKTPMELLSGVSFYNRAPIERYKGQTEPLFGKDVPVRLRYALTTILPQARILKEIDKFIFKKDTRKERLTPAEMAFDMALSTTYKINLQDLKERALQTIQRKLMDLQNGYHWAKKNQRNFEMERIKNTVRKTIDMTRRIKETDNIQNQIMEKTINKQKPTQPGIIRRLSDIIVPEAGAAPLPIDTQRFEGWSGKIYKDSEGIPTIGWGFNLQVPYIRGLIPKDVLAGKRELIQEEAQPIFNNLYHKAQKRAKTFIGEKYTTLPQDAKDILTDMSYNLGNRLLGFKRMRLALIKGNYNRAAAEMKDSKWYRQVKTRGQKLYNIMLGLGK